jgi:hypothetical protein
MHLINASSQFAFPDCRLMQRYIYVRSSITLDLKQIILQVQVFDSFSLQTAKKPFYELNTLAIRLMNDLDQYLISIVVHKSMIVVLDVHHPIEMTTFY